MTESGHTRSIDELDQSNYPSQETFSYSLDPTSNYTGIAILPDRMFALIFNHQNENILEIRSGESNDFPVKRSIVLHNIPNPIDDFCWCAERKEVLIMSDGCLFSYHLEEERVTNSLLIDREKNKCRVASNSTLIAAVDSRTLTLFDVQTLKLRRQKRLDHVCEDIEFDDEYFLSTHTGKLEFLNRSLFSIRRFAIGGTAISRFNKRLWLIADAFDDRLLWQSLDKLLLTICHIHQPKSLVVLPESARILVLCTEPNRLSIFDPLNSKTK